MEHKGSELAYSRACSLRIYLKTRHKYTNSRGCWLVSENADWSVYQGGKISSKTYPLHRMSAEAFGLPGFSLECNIDVLHKCDVKGCFNPEHLFLGNQTDNKKDFLNKRRQLLTRPFGEFILDFETKLNYLLDIYLGT